MDKPTKTFLSKPKQKASNSSTATLSSTAEVLLTPIATINVRIIGPTGKILVFKCKINKTLFELTNEAILELRKDKTKPLIATDKGQVEPRFRLIRADFDGCELDEFQTLEQLKIVNQETLLMLERRNVLQRNLVSIRDNRGPTVMEIDVATQNFKQKIVDVMPLNLNDVIKYSDIYFDVRKIIIPLAYASAAIIGAGPLANGLVASIKQKLINQRNQNKDKLLSLIDLGFKKDLCQFALKMSNGNYARSLEWLLQHKDNGTPAQSSATSMDSNISAADSVVIDDSIITNTEALLQIVRVYSQRDVPPKADALVILLEMGFSEQESLRALRKAFNNVPAACEYLIGYTATDNLLEIREGFAMTSPLFKKILEFPDVQIGLAKPNVFLAFLSILAREKSICAWGAENETSDVMKTILNSYNQEKHLISLDNLNTYFF